MSKRKRRSPIVGKTTDGRLVIGGVFAMRGAHGLPLADVFGILQLHGCLPSWEHFYRDAVADGWKHATIVAQLDEALVDAYGKRFRDEVLAYIEREHAQWLNAENTESTLSERREEDASRD